MNQLPLTIIFTMMRKQLKNGFTIREIGQLIDAWYNNRFSKEEKLSILDEKLLSLEQKMKEIKEMKKQIDAFKKDVLNDKC